MYNQLHAIVDVRVKMSEPLSKIDLSTFKVFWRSSGHVINVDHFPACRDTCTRMRERKRWISNTTKKMRQPRHATSRHKKEASSIYRMSSQRQASRSSARDHKDDASWYKYGRLATWTRQCTTLVLGVACLRNMERGEITGEERGEASGRINRCDHTQEPGRASSANIIVA